MDWKEIELTLFELFSTGDIVKVHKLRDLGLSDYQIEIGIIAGYSQLAVDGLASKRLVELLEGFAKEFPAEATRIHKLLLPPRGVA